MLSRDLDDRVELAAGELIAGRVIRSRDDDRARLRAHEPLERADIRCAAAIEVGVPTRDFGTKALRDRILRLIRRELHDEVIARLDYCVHEGEDRLLRAAVREDLLGVASLRRAQAIALRSSGVPRESMYPSRSSASRRSASGSSASSSLTGIDSGSLEQSK